ncbi:Obg family GTPase CgtA [Thiohalorhabdus sp.]|uniref:Obg family GTPase CgtA n=1 Tax=Thiohalorhabdus sp. TaxID=3094134 RepID=UPI002FC36990
MQFVDEAHIHVAAGAGGDGVVHFRREKYVPKGGPDGGDGGRGGNVVLVGDESLTTLVDFQYQSRYRAESGAAGAGGQRTGKSGRDCELPVPVGTQVYNAETDELIGDIVADGQRLRVAKGGGGGLGNVHFKSSTNRTPRQQTDGSPGERFDLRLELRLLADVGLVGLPNAGKSSLVRALSAAKPRVADYPFTTLQPALGVVRVDPERSFVMADIPGLIAGAAEGAGLGTQFLRHLARNHLLLHVVDIAPVDGSDPADNVRTVEAELAKYNEDLVGRKRWLVANKMDLVPESERDDWLALLGEELGWDGVIYGVSCQAGTGLRRLAEDIMTVLEEEREPESE